MNFLVRTIKNSLVTRNLELRTFLLFSLVLFIACGDFMEPVESTPEPTAYEFNYWLLNQTYLYEEELKDLPEKGDSIPLLYESLSDRYTRYYPPSKSEAAENQMNTSIVEGDLGMEYLVIYTEGDDHPYPILISRVYADSPAGRAKVPRYGRIISANGISMEGYDSKMVYDSIVAYSADVSLTVFFDDSLLQFDLTKETVYAPTVFLDTIEEITFVTITEFKESTADRENGTFGELRAYLDSTAGVSEPRVLDLRNNPGGLISQCLPAADLFVKEGLLSRRQFVSLTPDGKRTHRSLDVLANPGDPGENGKFLMLANRASASCAEIFIAATKEQGGIPLAGETTFGKGIGQSQWKTLEGGLAVITNLEFYTPKGNSYHKKGIAPDMDCPEGASRTCALNAVKTLYGNSPKTQSTKMPVAERAIKESLLASTKTTIPAKSFDMGGALDSVVHFVNYPYSP